jgi:DNA-binding transcriptional LysR family regulator
MDIADLRCFLVVAQDANLRRAALQLHQSPSALSKSIRRLEDSLRTRLFDRIGKSLQLNTQGELLRTQALRLVVLADETQAQFRGHHPRVHCRVAAPAMLQWRFGVALAEVLGAQHRGAGLAFSTRFEDAAMQAVAHGEADMALVTNVAVQSNLPAGLQSLDLGAMAMHLACGQSHPLVLQAQSVGGDGTSPSLTVIDAPETTAAGAQPAAQAIEVDLKSLLEFGFACPSRSLLCGIDRAARSDGWRDDVAPRRIQFWLDDLQLLTALVKAGHALAYLPDFALFEHGLVRLRARGYPFSCVEQAQLVWQPGTAGGWVAALVKGLARSR